jgi:hypothetical protein
MSVVQELDLIVKRHADGRWVVHQRRGETEPPIRGPYPTRQDAEAHARKLKESVRCDVFVEVTPGIPHKL